MDIKGTAPTPSFPVNTQQASSVQESQAEKPAPANQESGKPDFSLLPPGLEISVSKDPQSNRIVVKMLDSETKKVVREIPPERLQKILQSY